MNTPIAWLSHIISCGDLQTFLDPESLALTKQKLYKQSLNFHLIVG